MQKRGQLASLNGDSKQNVCSGLNGPPCRVEQVHPRSVYPEHPNESV
jgi:hypothetical protein